MTDPKAPTWRKPQTHYDLDECASLRAEVTRLTQELDEARARAIVAERHKALSLLGKSSWQQVVEDKLRVELAEAQIRAEQVEADLLLCQQEKDVWKTSCETAIQHAGALAEEIDVLREGIAPVVEAMRIASDNAAIAFRDQWADTLARLMALKDETL